MDSRTRGWFWKAVRFAVPRCFADGDGTALADGAGAAAAVADADPPAGDGKATVDLDLPDLPEGYFELNMGSKTVNPDGRPLRPDLRLTANDEELDGMIQMMGEDAFMDKKVLAAYLRKMPAKADPAKADDKAPVAPKKDEKVVAAKDDKAAVEDAEEAAFFADAGITKEDFLKLPEKAQEYMTSKYEATAKPAAEAEKIKADLAERDKTIAGLNADPYIRARLEEMRTGKALLAERKPLTIDELDKETMAALDLTADDQKALLTTIEKVVKERVKQERAIADRDANEERLRKEAWAVMSDMEKHDKRLAVGTNQYGKALDQSSGFGKAVKHFIDAGLTCEQIKTLGPKKLAVLYAAEAGWDAERDTQIAKNTEKSLLKRIKSAQEAKISSLPPGKRPPTSGQQNAAELDEDSLIASLVAGDKSKVEALIERHASDPAMLEKIERIQRRAVAASRERKRE